MKESSISMLIKIVSLFGAMLLWRAHNRRCPVRTVINFFFELHFFFMTNILECDKKRFQFFSPSACEYIVHHYHCLMRWLCKENISCHLTFCSFRRRFVNNLVFFLNSFASIILIFNLAHSSNHWPKKV